MAIIVTTSNPASLLSEIKKAINEGKIETWSCDSDGDFTHTPEQWTRRAWLRPSVLESKLIFNTLPPKTKAISRAVYGVYHGRFIEMLLNHFDEKFSNASATALPTVGDRIGTNTP